MFWCCICSLTAAVCFSFCEKENTKFCSLFYQSCHQNQLLWHYSCFCFWLCCSDHAFHDAFNDSMIHWFGEFFLYYCVCFLIWCCCCCCFTSGYFDSYSHSDSYSAHFGQTVSLFVFRLLFGVLCLLCFTVIIITTTSHPHPHLHLHLLLLSSSCFLQSNMQFIQINFPVSFFDDEI